MKEFEGKHGAKIVINVADWKSAVAFKSAIEKELVSAGKSSDVFFLLDSSKTVYDTLFECLKRCTYNNEKITEATFEPEKNREDFERIFRECQEVNLAPFFPRLASLLSGIMNGMEKKDIQEQK